MTNAKSWEKDLAKNILELFDEFEGPSILDKQTRNYNYCLHFFWQLNDYAKEIRQAFRDEESWRIRYFCYDTLPFITGKSFQKIELKSEANRMYVDILANIIYDYLGPDSCVSMSESINEMMKLIDTMETKSRQTKYKQ